MARILVTEKIAEGGLELLRRAGHDVDVQIGLSPDELLTAVEGAEALVIRSSTQVTAEVLAAGTDLVVVGRAGLGVDNVDVESATRRGIMVANAPGTNSLSTAEHAMALLLSVARNVPQSHSAMVDGRWEKSKWQGVELHGKTLGVLGLGRIGTLVAQRALAFGMRLIAWDPWTTPDRASKLGIELMEIDQLFAESDFVTVHLLKTAESVNIVNAELLAKAKPGLRIINAARGGLIDEQALADAIRNGPVGGAALDVFSSEPLDDSPLRDLPEVVLTPHLGASTREAQDKAGVTVAEQVALALAGDFVPFAVNIAADAASEVARPFLPLAERLGQVFVSLSEGVPDRLDIEYNGDLAADDTRILTLSVLKGVFGKVSEEPVTYVNAPQLAESRGMGYRETKTATAHDYVNLITLRGGEHSVAGTLVGLRSEPKIVMLDDHVLDVPPAANMLVVRNQDEPGIIAKVSSALGNAGVNIDDMHLGRAASGEAALMVLATTPAVPADVCESLRHAEGVTSVHVVTP